MDNKVIKKNFLEARRKEGLSWANLEVKAGIKSYRNILNALNSPGLSLATLERLARLVNLSPADLLKEDEPTDPRKAQQTDRQTFRVACPHCGEFIDIDTTAVATKPAPDKHHQSTRATDNDDNQTENENPLTLC